jgi:hypothetical protein
VPPKVSKPLRRGYGLVEHIDWKWMDYVEPRRAASISQSAD